MRNSVKNIDMSIGEFDIVSKKTKQKQDITEPLKPLEAMPEPGQAEERPANIGNAIDLLDAVAAISSPLGIHSVAQEAARQIINFTDADICAISRWDEKDNVVTLWAEYLRDQPNSPPAHLPYQASEFPTTEKVLLTSEPQQIHVDDPGLDPGEKTIMMGANAKSLLMLPLVAHGATIGLIEVFETKYKREFSDDQIANIYVLAQHAAISLERARLLTEAEQRAAELEAIRQASLSLTASLDRKDVFNSILKSALKLSPDALDAYIFTIDAEDGSINYGASLWSTREEGQIWKNVRPEGLTATVARNGKVIVVEDVVGHPLFKNSHWVKNGWEGSIIGMPLKSGVETVGVMNIAFRKRQEFSKDQLRVLGLLSDQAALAILNSRLHEIVKRQAITDQLTGLHNRRAFDERLDGEIRRSSRYNHTFALVMIDVDNFKSVNDTHGHLIGDRVLQTVAHKLENSTRDTDFVARFGGDEFALILPETTHEQAKLLGEKINKIISRQPFNFQQQDQIVQLPLSLSMGVAGYPFHALKAEDLIETADNELYKDKHK
jgi:diguanylate cyclase (GGDEF)-like protein